MKSKKKLIIVIAVAIILGSTAVVGGYIKFNPKSKSIKNNTYVDKNKSSSKDENISNSYATSYNPSEVDKIYADGVNAVLKCQNEKTQGSINEARACISKFKGKLDWAIGELSKQVDGIQNIILTSIVDGINRNQKQPVQKEVDIIRKNILDLPVEDWKKCYSSALDKAQQILINKTSNKSAQTDTNVQNSTNNTTSQKTNQNKSRNTSQNTSAKDGQVDNKGKDKKQIVSKNVTKAQVLTNDKFMKEVETIILQKVNEERRKAGLGELKYNSVMEKYARIKSQDMGDKNYFDHRDLQGNLITVRMQQDGVNYNAWGENIAYIGGGNSDAQSLANQFMNMWMNSPGHRANILSTNFNSMGVGVYKIGNKIYATQEFYR